MHAHLRVDPPPILEKGGQRFADWLPKMCKKPHPKVWGPNYGNTRPDKCKRCVIVRVRQTFLNIYVCTNVNAKFRWHEQYIMRFITNGTYINHINIVQGGGWSTVIVTFVFSFLLEKLFKTLKSCKLKLYMTPRVMHISFYSSFCMILKIHFWIF